MRPDLEAGAIVGEGVDPVPAGELGLQAWRFGIGVGVEQELDRDGEIAFAWADVDVSDTAQVELHSVVASIRNPGAVVFVDYAVAERIPCFSQAPGKDVGGLGRIGDNGWSNVRRWARGRSVEARQAVLGIHFPVVDGARVMSDSCKQTFGARAVGAPWRRVGLRGHVHQVLGTRENENVPAVPVSGHALRGEP